MKTLLLTFIAVSFLSVSSVKAQKQATQDDNKYIMTVRTQKATGRTQEIHYTLTNNNSVSMDFSLYKQLTNGSWDVTHHLDLQPGHVYEDVSGFTSVNGRYVVYSAPHSDWASFPSSFDIAKLQPGNTAAPAATTSATATTSTPAPTTSTAPAPAPVAPAAPGKDPLKPNEAVPVTLPPL